MKGRVYTYSELYSLLECYHEAHLSKYVSDWVLVMQNKADSVLLCFLPVFGIVSHTYLKHMDVTLLSKSINMNRHFWSGCVKMVHGVGKNNHIYEGSIHTRMTIRSYLHSYFGAHNHNKVLTINIFMSFFNITRDSAKPCVQFESIC